MNIMIVSPVPYDDEAFRMMPKEFVDMVSEPKKYYDYDVDLPTTPIYFNSILKTTFSDFFLMRTDYTDKRGDDRVERNLIELMKRSISPDSNLIIADALRYCDDNDYMVQLKNVEGYDRQ